MRFQRQIITILNVKAENGQLSLFGHIAVQLPQRAGRRIARIGKQRFALQLTLSIDGVKHRAAHIHLAAHNQCFRRTVQDFGNVRNRAQIVRDILTCDAVTARRAAHKDAIFVFQ